jgi:hypothetical protein
MQGLKSTRHVIVPFVEASIMAFVSFSVLGSASTSKATASGEKRVRVIVYTGREGGREGRREGRRGGREALPKNNGL